jgi:putative tricarboxylic transport membrane protein
VGDLYSLLAFEGAESWRIVVPMALVMTLFVYGLFDQLLSIPWPGSLLGDVLPVLKDLRAEHVGHGFLARRQFV